MYAEKSRKRLEINWKSFFIKFAILLVVVFLVLWLISIVRGDNNNTSNFGTNLQAMRNAATEYFTGSRLPDVIGDSESITLGEMFEQNLLVEFQDEDGNDCNTSESMAEVTKISDEDYRLEVTLVCENDRDTIVNTIQYQGNDEPDDSSDDEEPLDENPVDDNLNGNDDSSNGQSNTNNQSHSENLNNSSQTNNNSNNNSQAGNVGIINVSSVSLDYQRIVVNVGQSRTVKAYIYPTNATNQTVSWSSSNAGVASVNNGVITGHQAGTVTVTAQVGGKTASVEVVVVSSGEPPVSNTCHYGSTDYYSNLYILALGVEENCALSYQDLYQQYSKQASQIGLSEYSVLTQEVYDLSRQYGVKLYVDVPKYTPITNRTGTGYVGFQISFVVRTQETYSKPIIYAYYLNQNGERQVVVNNLSTLKKE